MEDTLTLGGNIELSGFSQLDSGSMVILKKIIGNYAKKIAERSSNFEKIKITMKPVHERERSGLYEIHGHLFMGGKPVVSEETDRNMFFAVDKVLKRLESNL